jgi:hypothetical protein
LSGRLLLAYYTAIAVQREAAQRIRAGAWLVILNSASLLVRAFIFSVLLSDSPTARSSAADSSWYSAYFRAIPAKSSAADLSWSMACPFVVPHYF